MKKTFKKLLEIDNLVGQMYLDDPSLKKSKFGYAYKRFFQKNLQKLNEEYQAELMDVRINNALVDERTQEILAGNARGGFRFTKEGLRQVLKDEKRITEEWEKKEIEVEPFISSFVPENLTEEQKEELTELLI